MKKYLSIIFLFLLLFLLASCQSSVSVFSPIETAPPDASPEDILPGELGVTVKGENIYAQKDIGGESYTLYLPAYTEDIKWCLPWYIEVDGKIYGNGMSADILLSSDSFTVSGHEIKVMRSANIPALFISTNDGTMENVDGSGDHSYGVGGTYSVISAEGTVLHGGSFEELRGRGNSTWYGPEKKPYQIKLSAPEALLGLTKSRKYVLLANYYDPSLIRNSIAMQLSKAYDGYTVSGEHIDLYTCGIYRGTYLLCEKIDIGKDKIDIFDLEKASEKLAGGELSRFPRGGDTETVRPMDAKWYEIPSEIPNIDGGYLLEIDYAARYAEEPCGFVTSRGMPVVIKSPKYASRAQVEYIQKYVCDFEDALYSPTGYNGDGKHFSEYADVGSLVFRYLFEEFSLNIDGGVSSFYIFKDSGGKLNFSTVWDYDVAFGNCSMYVDLTSPETLFTASMEMRDNGTLPNWFYAAMEHDSIRAKVSEYYKNSFGDTAEKLMHRIFDEAEYISASAEMNSYLYRSCEGRLEFNPNAGDTPDAAAEYLFGFYSKRLEFFDRTFG